jgi:hypothetical protein
MSGLKWCFFRVFFFRSHLWDVFFLFIFGSGHLYILEPCKLEGIRRGGEKLFTWNIWLVEFIMNSLWHSRFVLELCIRLTIT